MTETNQDIIDTLTIMLEQAKKGEIKSLLCAGEFHDGDVKRAILFEDRACKYKIVGVLQGMMHDILTHSYRPIVVERG